MRTFARACRRAALPLRLTQGFDPRPRLVFATALELGVESEVEILEMELSRWRPPETIKNDLNQQLPAEMSVNHIKLLPPRRGGERAVEITYCVQVPGGTAASSITQESISEFLARPALPFDRQREKRIQHIDLRPSLMDIRLESEALYLILRPTSKGSARPSEILSLLTGKAITEIKRWPTKKTAMQMAP